MPYSVSWRLLIAISLNLAMTAVNSQSMPVLDSVGNDYVLTIPYLEHNVSQSSQQAYAATLSSSNLLDFSLSSVAKIELSGNSSNTPSNSVAAGGFQLKIPYLQVSNSSSIYSVNLSSPPDLSFFGRYTINSNGIYQQ